MKQFLMICTSLLVFMTTVCQAEGAVWKIEKNGKHLFLGGTIHLLNSTDYPLPDAYDQAFDGSDILVLEADIEQFNKPEVALQIQQLMMYQDGRTLKSILAPDVYEKFKNYLNSRQMSDILFNQMKAGAVSMTLSVMELQKLGFNQAGVDAYYLQQAKKQNKPLAYLESLDYQMTFIANLGEGIENEIVSSTIDEMASLPEYMDKLRTDWRTANLEGLEDFALKDMRDYPSVYEALLLTRNQNWFPQLEDMLQTEEVESVFVGVLHLVGKDGLLHLLEEKGYRVSPL